MDIYYLILVIPALILSIYAQSRVTSTFKKYSQVLSRSNVSGSYAAQNVLQNAGVSGVHIHPINGSLTDHYDPRKNSIGLSEPVHSNTSVAAIGVAAHEAGHAIQYANGYVPIKIRNTVLPVAQIGCSAAFPIAILGIFLSMPFLIDLGIVLYGAVVLFQVATLPVEFNASRRALASLGNSGILSADELAGAKKVLSAAALTYVAATLTTLMSFLRLILLSRSRD